jgi:hypothetical protein
VGREAILLAPRLQPGDGKAGIGEEPFLTVLCPGRIGRNRWKRFKESFTELDHRAKAAVLMRSLRVPPIASLMDPRPTQSTKVAQRKWIKTLPDERKLFRDYLPAGIVMVNFFLFRTTTTVVVVLLFTIPFAERVTIASPFTDSITSPGLSPAA